MPNKAKTVAPVLPHEVHAKIIDFFLANADSDDGRERDPFGEIPLRYLTDLLYELKVATHHWDRVAHFAIKKAHGHVHYYYTATLLSVSPHVSHETRELIVAHFVKHGDVDNATHLATVHLYRMPIQEEVMVMAEYHHKKETSSENEIWTTLCRFANAENFERIKRMRSNVFYKENNGDILDLV